MKALSGRDSLGDLGAGCLDAEEEREKRETRADRSPES